MRYLYMVARLKLKEIDGRAPPFGRCGIRARKGSGLRFPHRHSFLDFGTGLLERVGTGLVGTIGYVVLPTGVSTDVSRDIV